MSTIAVIGGTGYTGTNIVREAAGRGHQVISLSRSAPSEPVEGVRYEHGEVLEHAPALVEAADAVVAALSPRGDTAGTIPALYGRLAELAAEHGTRLIVIGGFSSLRPSPDAPRFVEGDIPEQFAAEATEMDAARQWLQDEAPEQLDWLFVSPAGSYGSFNPGEARGTYRTGGEIALFDDDGESAISGADFALAVVDEIDDPQHRRAHIGVAY